MGEKNATIIMHLFVSVTYACAVLGGFLSDSYLGKFKTISYLSVVYILGSVLLSLGSVKSIMGDPPLPYATYGALILIALGTGGIKSSVSAFVGDQIHPTSADAITSVFMYFYFMINAGSLISTIITPILKNNSYALAYGVPAILLLVSLIILFAGKSKYVITPPGGNIFAHIYRVIKTARREKKLEKERGEVSNKKFLDYAVPIYSHKEVEDIRSLYRVLLVFIPLPIYWSLFDQHSSKWVFMSKEMDTNLFGIKIQPEHVQMLNPLLLLIMVVVFDVLIFPFFRRRNIKIQPLKHKMVIGMIFTALSFVMSGGIQMYMNKMAPKKVSILLIIPQFFLMAIGEVLVSATGLDFSYSQSPKYLKSIVMASWFVAVAIGNILVSLISLIPINHRAMEFFLYATIMIMFVVIFYIIVYDFKYKEINNNEEEGDGEDDDDDNMKKSLLDDSRERDYE